MTFQDVRIPGLKMTVVQADGQNVQPVEVDEFRMGPAETYDVIVEPKEDRAYAIFAETLDRSGYASGTLAPRSGMIAAIPERRPRPIRTMEDMGMAMGGADTGPAKTTADDKMAAGMNAPSEVPGKAPVKHGPDHHGSANQATPEVTPAAWTAPALV